MSNDIPSDFYTQSAARRAAELDAERSEALADLARAKAEGDTASASYSVQRIADIDAASQNLLALHQRYLTSQNPPAPEPATEAEIVARPWNRMTPDDALSLARKSKYSADLDWNDPNVRAGWQEAQRRRRAG